MKLTNDDAVLSLDNVFKGPPGYTLPWSARYSAYVVGFFVALFVLFVVRKIGVHSVPVLVMLVSAGTVGITTAIMSLVNYDRPARSLPVTLWHEIGAPRDPKAVAVTVSMAKVRVG